MIFYNMRYRGPYEYEKFILNIYQYQNLVNDIANDTREKAQMWTTLKQLEDNTETIFEKTIGDNGLLEEVYKKFIMINRRV